MELTPTARRLVERAAAQIVRELSKTPVGKLVLTGAPTATPWISVEPVLGKEGGVKYIRAGLGMRGTGYEYAGAPGLIEAIAKQDLPRAHRIVEEVIAQILISGIVLRQFSAAA